ncbi:hypothetical protein [Streptomyces sp. KR80]|uniref:hypothetical protein n=1 Tax=Streptomyces sp. KR80 TaxID=3457426 RepID=UPI003FD12BD8
MRRHDLEPGKLIAGLVLLGTGVAYGLDAAGAWAVPAWALFPVLAGGLCLAALAGGVTAARRRSSPSLRPGGAPSRGGRSASR